MWIVNDCVNASGYSSIWHSNKLIGWTFESINLLKIIIYKPIKLEMITFAFSSIFLHLFEKKKVFVDISKSCDARHALKSHTKFYNLFPWLQNGEKVFIL